MNNLIAFTNSFLSYVMLVLVFVIVAGIAVFIGIKARKHKNTKMNSNEDGENAEDVTVADAE